MIERYCSLNLRDHNSIMGKELPSPNHLSQVVSKFYYA